MSATILDSVWDGAGDTWHWLRGVILGEWEDDRSVSQVVTDALAGFVPGVGSIITLRDLLAVIVRLARHPDKRDDVNEWILLVAMLLPLLITVLGAAAAGVGALVGAELGGFLRAVALFIVKKGGVALKAMVEFFQAHGYGDVVKALRQVKFAQYKNTLIKGMDEQLDKLVSLVQGFRARLQALNPQSLPAWLPGRDAAIAALHKSGELIEQINTLRAKAREMIPKALIEMDQRLGALLAGDIKAATQVTHTIQTGTAAPEVAKLKPEPGQPAMRNPEPPEPGNTRRVAERRIVALAGKREYGIVDKAGRPVGAKPYVPGATKVEHPPLKLEDWDELSSSSVKQGWPDLANEYRPGKRATDYNTFSSIRPASLPAGSNTTLKRVVSHDGKPQVDAGAFWNRELPLDGEDLRAGSAVKEDWNKNGQFVELRVPPKGDAVWKELHALQEKAAGGPVPYKEELKFWEGPAASQVYEKQLPDGSKVPDDWYLGGGKPQQFFDRGQMALLQERGFITERKVTGFKDYDADVVNANGSRGNIVPKDGPFLEIVPLDEAVPPPAKQ